MLVVLLGGTLVEELLVAFWFDVLVLGLCAGGFTGALWLSPCAPAWVVLVVAAGAFALLASVVGVWLLPVAAGGLLLEAALWSVLLGVAVLLVLEAALPSEGAPVPAWLLVHESEIMLTAVA